MSGCVDVLMGALRSVRVMRAQSISITAAGEEGDGVLCFFVFFVVVLSAIVLPGVASTSVHLSAVHIFRRQQVDDRPGADGERGEEQ